MNIESHLFNIVGDRFVTTESADLETYGLDWTRFYTPAASAIVFPQSTEQVQQLVELARKEEIRLVPSGGRTGLSGGACATDGEIVVSFDRMNQITGFNASDSSVTVQPGVVTAALQDFAAENGLYYPVDFASSGSSQIGGNIATNAGGIRVIRYGMTRDWVSGLKVVTGTGELLDLNRGLVKNNTGYDLRHLFIGSEGTLGFIVEATMQLTQPPLDASVVLLAVPAMEHCLGILDRFRGKVTLNAFEFFSDLAVNHVVNANDMAKPFVKPSPFYVLLEFEHTHDDSMDCVLEAYEDCIASGIATDAVVSSSQQQNLDLWQYRERISEAITPLTPYKNDISVRVGRTPEFLAAIDAVITRHHPDFEVLWYGHIGDGNLHLNILRPESWSISDFKNACDDMNDFILEVVRNFDGSISAEHGVGLLKKNHLPFTRSATEIEALQSIKRTFDPDGIMNPGKLL